MALVKKLCTAMLLLCLSLVVMVGTAYADDCDLNPRFIRFEKLQPNQRGYVQLVESKDSKVLSNVRIDAYSLENDMQTYSFEAVNPSEPMPVSNVEVEGLRTSPAPQVKDLVVFEEGGAFTSFTVSATDNFENYFVLSAICADSNPPEPPPVEPEVGDCPLEKPEFQLVSNSQRERVNSVDGKWLSSVDLTITNRGPYQGTLTIDSTEVQSVEPPYNGGYIGPLFSRPNGGTSVDEVFASKNYESNGPFNYINVQAPNEQDDFVNYTVKLTGHCWDE